MDATRAGDAGRLIRVANLPHQVVRGNGAAVRRAGNLGARGQRILAETLADVPEDDDDLSAEEQATA